MQTIRWIIFDIGGVIIELNFHRSISALARLTGHPPEQVRDIMMHTPSGIDSLSLSEAFSTGRIARKNYLDRMTVRLGNPLTSEMLQNLIERELKAEMPASVRFVRTCKKNFQVACYSNSNEIHWDYLLKQFPAMELFSIRMASHLAGFRKPDHRAYAYICKRLQIAPAEGLLIDDRLENIEAAQSFGMTAIAFENIDQLESDFQKRIRHAR